MYTNDLLLHYIYYVVVTHRILHHAYIHSSRALQYVNARVYVRYHWKMYVGTDSRHRIRCENSIGKFRTTAGRKRPFTCR